MAKWLKWGGGVFIAAVFIWFVYNVFFIQEGEVIVVSQSPTGAYTVFISEKNSVFSKQPKYVAAYVEMDDQSSNSRREIFYYSPDPIEGEQSISWKNRDTIVISGHELRLPLDRHHYLIR